MNQKGVGPQLSINNEGINFFCKWEVTIIKVLPAPTYLEDVELQMD